MPIRLSRARPSGRKRLRDNLQPRFPRLRFSSRAAVVFFLAFLFGSALPAAPADAPDAPSGELQRSLDSVLKVALREGEIPGAVVLIGLGDEILYHRAVGLANLEKNSRMRTDAVFRLASMTKPISAAAFLTLWEEGKFKLDDPVEKYIPEFHGQRIVSSVTSVLRFLNPYRYLPPSRPVQIIDLLRHTSGIAHANDGPASPFYSRDTVANQQGSTIEQQARAFGRLPLNFEPGSEFQYSRGIDVLGYLIEIFSGMPFEEFVRQRIFSPLGMTNTTFVPSKDQKERMPPIYRWSSETGLLARNEEAWIDPLVGAKGYPSPSNGLIGTAEDYFRFSRMLLNHGQDNGRPILRASTVEKMLSNQIGDLPMWPELAGWRYGLGIAVLEGRDPNLPLASPGTVFWFGNTGVIIWMDPKKQLTVIVMTQVTSDTGIACQQEISRHAFALAAP